MFCGRQEKCASVCVLPGRATGWVRTAQALELFVTTQRCCTGCDRKLESCSSWPPELLGGTVNVTGWQICSQNLMRSSRRFNTALQQLQFLLKNPRAQLPPLSSWVELSDYHGLWLIEVGQSGECDLVTIKISFLLFCSYCLQQLWPTEAQVEPSSCSSWSVIFPWHLKISRFDWDCHLWSSDLDFDWQTLIGRHNQKCPTLLLRKLT